jgi:hypothetical protein
MQIRLSVKAREQIKLPALKDSDSAAENRYCEWCVDIVTAGRNKYFLVCNAYSLFGVCFPAAGITSAEKFSDAFVRELKSYLAQKSLFSLFETYIEGSIGKIDFYKTYNLRVRSGMNGLKLFLSFSFKTGASQEKINDRINNYITSACSDKKEYRIPKDMFISEDMKKPAVQAVRAIKENVQAVQFYIELKDLTPKLWRRFIIREDVKMTTLGYAILSMIKASGGHLFNFELQGAETLIELPDPYGEVPARMKVIDARKVKVGTIFADPQTRCLFTYDFGDNWEFELKQEKVIPDAPLTTAKPVKVTGGENYGIVDDCGGAGGLEELIDVYTKGSGTRYEEFKAWFGEEQFDFSVFNKEEINSCLAGDIRMYKSNYENPQW